MLTGIYSTSSRQEPPRPVRFTLAPSYAPRGVSIPFDLTQLAYLPSPWGCGFPQLFSPLVYPERAFAKGHSPLITRHFPFVFTHLRTLYLSLRSFSGSRSFFSTACRLFCQNTRGCGGGSSLAFKRPDAPSASRSNFWTLGGSRPLPEAEMYLRDGQTDLQTFVQKVTTRGGRCNRSWS